MGRRELPGTCEAGRAFVMRFHVLTVEAPPGKERCLARSATRRKVLLPKQYSAELVRIADRPGIGNGPAPAPITKSSYETMSNVTMSGLGESGACCPDARSARGKPFWQRSRSASDPDNSFNTQRRASASPSIASPPSRQLRAPAVSRRRRQDPRSCQIRIPITGTPPPTTRC